MFNVKSIANFILIFLIMFSAILLYGIGECGEDSQVILVVQSMRIEPYAIALKGFQETCPGIKVKQLVLSEVNGLDVVKEIRKIKPTVILAIGVDALSRVKRIADIPIVYLMVLSPESIISEEKNITGVSMNIPMEKQLSAFHLALPAVKTIGTIFDQAKVGSLLEGVQYAEKLGIKLILKKAGSPKEVPSLLNSMKREIDAFWMLPDTTVMCPETIEFLFLSSVADRIPILTFSDKYIEMGALLSLNINSYDLGKQAGEIAQRILSGKEVSDIPGVEARETILSINLKTARKLGTILNDEIINKTSYNKIINKIKVVQ